MAGVNEELDIGNGVLLKQGFAS